MDMTTIWWILAGLAVVAELLTGTIYLLMIALGLTAGALAAHLGWNLPAQIVLTAAVAVICMSGIRLMRRKRIRLPAAADPNVNLDIGAQVHVSHWAANGTTQVQYRGAQWRAVHVPCSEHPSPGNHRVVAIEGSQLVLEPLKAD